MDLVKYLISGITKMKRNIYLIAVFVGIIFFLPAHSAIAGIINPGFTEGDDGLDGWTHNDFVGAWTTGSVQFAPDPDRQQNDSYLWQAFTLDPGSKTLSFNGEISVPSETGIFTAALLDPVTGDPLVPSVDGQGHFFKISSEQIPVGQDNLDFTCSLDVSSLSGQEVKLVFNLNNDYLNASDSYVVLSNLNLTVIPEPATICILGLGALSLLRKHRA